MNALKTQLYREMARTIHLLGGESELLKVMDIIDSPMSQEESIDEIYRLLKCYNDNVESTVEDVTRNTIDEFAK